MSVSEGILIARRCTRGPAAVHSAAAVSASLAPAARSASPDSISKRRRHGRAAPGGGHHSKPEEQPHAKQIAHAPEPPMWTVQWLDDRRQRLGMELHLLRRMASGEITVRPRGRALERALCRSKRLHPISAKRPETPAYRIHRQGCHSRCLEDCLTEEVYRVGCGSDERAYLRADPGSSHHDCDN